MIYFGPDNLLATFCCSAIRLATHLPSDHANVLATKYSTPPNWLNAFVLLTFSATKPRTEHEPEILIREVLPPLDWVMGAVAVLIAVSLLSVCGLSFSHGNMLCRCARACFSKWWPYFTPPPPFFLVSLQCQKGLLHDQDLEEKKLTFKARYDAVDESHCQHICTQHPECHFFTFVRPDSDKKRRQVEIYFKYVEWWCDFIGPHLSIACILLAEF